MSISRKLIEAASGSSGGDPIYDPDDIFAVNTANTAGDGSFESGFPVDMAIRKFVSQIDGPYVASRLGGPNHLLTSSSDAEVSDPTSVFDGSAGWSSGWASDPDHLSWMWRCAPGHFDVVAYEGDRQDGRKVTHNLGVVPEMMWVKKRTAAGSWPIYHSALGATQDMLLDKDLAARVTSVWSNTEPTESNIALGADGNVNGVGEKYIAYLFASAHGVSKVGTYTGTGSTTDVEVDCGFTAGARWVLIKATNTTGDWLMTTPTSALNFMIKLNSDAAMIGEYGVTPTANGFKVGGGNANTNTNARDVEYIYYAIA